MPNDCDSELSIEMMVIPVIRTESVKRTAEANDDNPKRIKIEENHVSLGETKNEESSVAWNYKTSIEIPSQRPYLRI